MGWDDLRAQVGQALSMLQARDRALQGTRTTLDTALLETLVDLDSSQADPVALLGSGSSFVYGSGTGVRRGQLQRLQLIEATFFGSGGSGGLLSALSSLPSPGEDG